MLNNRSITVGSLIGSLRILPIVFSYCFFSIVSGYLKPYVVDGRLISSPSFTITTMSQSLSFSIFEQECSIRVRGERQVTQSLFLNPIMPVESEKHLPFFKRYFCAFFFFGKYLKAK